MNYVEIIPDIFGLTRGEGLFPDLLLMQQVHNSKKRMPAILPENLAMEWIQDGVTEQRIKEIATYRLPLIKATKDIKDIKT